MKKIWYNLSILFFSVGLMGALAVMLNCVPDKEPMGLQYDPTIEVNSEESTMGHYYKSLSDYSDNLSASVPYRLAAGVKAGSEVACYVDARTSGGVSNWNEPYVTTILGFGDISEGYCRPVLTITPSAPPLYLHLVAEDWDDPYCLPKSWMMSEVLDEDGLPVTDPDLVNFTDDRVVFKKGGRVQYFPGTLRTGEEDDILNETESDYYFGTYLVLEGPDRIRIIPASREGEVFEVLESSYTVLRLRATREGKVGYLTLVPSIY